jgi:rod shape-determining protein MreD
VNKFIPAAIALAAAAVLQIALAPYLAIFGVVPKFLFVVVVVIALTEGSVAGCVAGFSAGLLLDLLGSGVVGPYALVMCVVGYLAGMLQANLFAEGWLLPVTTVFVASLGTEISYGIILSVLGLSGSFWHSLFTVMLPGAVYNTALALVTYPWLARLLRADRGVKSLGRLA